MTEAGGDNFANFSIGNGIFGAWPNYLQEYAFVDNESLARRRFVTEVSKICGGINLLATYTPALDVLA